MRKTLPLLLLFPVLANAAEVSVEDAANAARAWVDRGYAMGKLPAGRTVDGVDEVRDPATGAKLLVARFTGGGYVVLSSDDLVDPVIAFSETGTGLDLDEGNPFWALLRADIEAREAAAGVERGAGVAKRGAAAKASGTTAAQRKWADLLSRETGGGRAPALRATKAAAGRTSLSDVRVDSFVRSRWSQSNHAGTSIGEPCYNYYVTNRYVCGCVSTATSQLMRYWEYPTAAEPVVSTYYLCYVGNTPFLPRMFGGTYDWDNMPLDPRWVADITEEECQAIGKLTYDVGVAVGMQWKSTGSSAEVPSTVAALKADFHYASAHAVVYANSGSGAYSLASFKKGMIPNLDARCPCILSIQGSGGHAILADGYGYSDGDFFIHVNMGWAGEGDAWYNPPNIEEYTSIRAFVYNVFPRKTGSIASGRVLDQIGNPVAGADVALSDGQTAVSDANGVYAFIAPAGTYDITAAKDGFTAGLSVTLAETAGTPVKTNQTEHGHYNTGVGTNGNVCDNDILLADMPATAKPVFSPGSCAFHPATNVAISCADASATIRYTVDGSAPDESSPVYAGPIRVDDTVTLKARAFAPGCNASAVAVADYVYDPGDGPPKGDNFDDPIEIRGASGTYVVADNEAYTIEDGEPVHVVVDGTPKPQLRSIWYRWTAPATGRVLFRTYCRNGNSAYWTNIAAYRGDTLATAEKIAFSTTYDANFAQLLPLDVVQGDTYRFVGMINSTNPAAAFGTFTLRWDDEFPTGGDPTPVLGSCTAAVDGTNVAFSVALRKIEAPAAVSVFYGLDESHLTELSLGTANASGTLTATATGLANGTYVWYARAVSEVDGVPYAAESARKTFTVNWVPPPEGMLVADGFSADDYTAGTKLQNSTGGDTTGFTSARPWSAKTVTGVLFVNDDGLSLPAGWDAARYPSGGYSIGLKNSGTTTTSDIRGACRQLADGAFPTSGTIYYRILLRHGTGAGHCPTNCYRAAGFLPQDFTSLNDKYAEKQGTSLFNKGLWLGTRGKGDGTSSVNLRLGSQDLVLVDTMQEGVTYLCVARMDIDADGANETATGFAVPVDDYTAPAWPETVLREDVIGASAPLAWFGVVGGYKTSGKCFSFDELAVSTILADVVPVPGTGPAKPVFRAAADGGALALDGGSLSLNLVACEADCWYAPFTNATVAGPFYAAADGVHPAADGTLQLSVPARDDAKFVVVGASLEPIHEGDVLDPAPNP
ncbi:MAG: C10 family peptidase [Kiritimatiellae bacterium]|nr:C10 family peptidase [Kiritimatiellia bacterium]